MHANYALTGLFYAQTNAIYRFYVYDLVIDDAPNHRQWPVLAIAKFDFNNFVYGIIVCGEEDCQKNVPKSGLFCVGHAPATSPDFSGLNKPPQASRFRFFGFLIIYEWVCQICQGHSGPATLALMVILCPVPMMTQTGERINHLNHCPDHGRTLLFK